MCGWWLSASGGEQQAAVPSSRGAGAAELSVRGSARDSNDILAVRENTHSFTSIDSPHIPDHLRHEAAAATMSQPSITKFVLKRSWLKSWMVPLSNWYANAAGYRSLGLRCVVLQRAIEAPLAAHCRSNADIELC